MEFTIIGIDPGASGSIAVYHKKKVAAVAMPDTSAKMTEYFRYLATTYPDAVVFIEKVNAWNADDKVGGKKYGIQKLLDNRVELITNIKIFGLQFVQVHPMTWQNALGLKMPGGTEKAVRKSLYRDYAQRAFPQLRVTLATADSLCLILFAEQAAENYPMWISERLENRPKDRNTLF